MSEHPVPRPSFQPLPPEVQAHLSFLEEQVAALQVQVTMLQEQVRALQEENTELRARLNRNSHNSSRPPSSDPPTAPKRPARPTKGRSRGGQKGHPGRHRAMIPADRVDHFRDHWPATCPHCQHDLTVIRTETTPPQRQQVWEIPSVRAEVTEHRYHAVSCPVCGAAVRSERPPEVPAGALGPRATAWVGLLHGRYRLSERETVELSQDLWQLPLALGSVHNRCAQVSAALESPAAEVQDALGAAAHGNVDETGWKQAGRRYWLWVLVGGLCTRFLLSPSRSRATLRQLLGEEFRGIVSSDRFRAYQHLPVERRQICWAHLQRDLCAFSEWQGACGEWGARGVALVKQLFAHWAAFRTGQIDRPALQTAMQPVREQFAALLIEGLTMPRRAVQGFCRDLQWLEPALWTFLRVEEVEPTNNAAERALRPAVIWRKGCFGTQSDGGARFVERILTVAATCRQQGRHLLTFLTEAVQAHWTGNPAPLLLTT